MVASNLILSLVHDYPCNLSPVERARVERGLVARLQTCPGKTIAREMVAELTVLAELIAVEAPQ